MAVHAKTLVLRGIPSRATGAVDVFPRTRLGNPDALDWRCSCHGNPHPNRADVLTRSRLVHALLLGLILLVTWLLLSGIFDPLILAFGLASCVFVVWIAMRMDVIDHEAVPVHLTSGGLVFWPWLLWQIVKANIDVARRVLSPSAGVTPTMTEIVATQRTDLGRVVLANSITLTPGTITVDIAEDGRTLVHSLTREGIESLGEMDRRVSAMEGMAPGMDAGRC